MARCMVSQGHQRQGAGLHELVIRTKAVIGHRRAKTHPAHALVPIRQPQGLRASGVRVPISAHAQAIAADHLGYDRETI